MKSFHQTKGSFLLSLIAALLFGSCNSLKAQETSPIPLTPVIELPAAVPDATVPPASVPSTTSDDVPAAEALQIPQEVPMAIPQIQPAVAIEPAAVAQDPPAPVPQAETALPPINADEMAEDDQDELLRGPVHEAYAEQLNADPVAGLVIPQKPPEAIEEVPPELKPDGRQVEWISGYWAWDEDQDDFIWISGIWREVPQGFRWLPGYWTEVEGGFQWVNGTWVSTQTSEITYLNDAPPETLEQGPVGNSPSEQHIWIPGTWTWNETRYAWRPGYWSTGYENWIWVPARYQWTPRGYYYCDGYWDYPVQRRGVLFAPYHFHRRFRPRRIARFTPRVVVASNLLTVHFWVRPRYRHYYFGDYYNVGFANRGLTPWHQFPRQRRCFDPLYAHYGRGRRSNDFYNQLNVQFNVFVNQPNRRPPVRFRDQDRWARDNRMDFRGNDFLGNRFQNVVENASRSRDGFQFVRLENQQREQVQQETRRLRELMDQRRDVERSLAQLDRLRDRDGDRGPNDRGGFEGRDLGNRGAEGRGPEGRGSEVRGSDGRGPGGRGSDGKGPEDRGPDANGKDGVADLRDRLIGGNERDGKNRDGENGDSGRKNRDREDPAVPNIDVPKIDSVKTDVTDAVKNEIQDAKSRGRDARDNVTDGTGTDNSATTGDRGNLTGDRDSARGNRRDRLKLPATETPSDSRTNKPSDNAGASGGDVVKSDQSGGESAKSTRGESAESRSNNRDASRERLKLPPSTRPGNATAENPNGGANTSDASKGAGNAGPSQAKRGSGNSSGTDAGNSSRGSRSTLDSIRNARSRPDSSNSDTKSSPVGGGGSETPSVDLPGTRSRGIDRLQNRSTPAGNALDKGAGDSVPRGDFRSRGNSGSRTVPPLNGGDASGTDKSRGTQTDANPPRDAAKASSREPAARNVPSQRDRSPVAGLNPGASPGNERASRREAPPKVDSPPAASGRLRGGEPRGNPGNSGTPRGNAGNPGGNPGGRGGGDSGADRAPRNNPSMGTPRGGDTGGGRASNSGSPARGAGGVGGGGRRESGGGGAGAAGAGGGGGRRGRDK